MKFRNRIALTLTLGLIFFSSTAVLFWKQMHQSNNGYPAVVDIYAIRRSLNMAESNSKEIPGLLNRILDRPMGNSNSEIWNTLLHNDSVAEAWIKVAHVLELQKKNQNDNLIVSVDEQTRIGSHDNQNNLGVLSELIISNLTDILYKSIGYVNAHRKHEKLKDQLNMYKRIAINKKTPSFQRFQAGISRYSLYSDAEIVDDLLKDLATQPITSMQQMEGGTQIKLKFTLADRSNAVFKPMRFPRGTETLPNHFYFSDYERHIAEIAAFHLDRVLDFRHVPPVSGRVVNITNDIWRFAHLDHSFEKTVFISPAGNVCFHGKCDYYCDTGHAICGRPELLEGSMATFLPPSEVARRARWRHPWRRSYSKRKKAKWETDDNFCKAIRSAPPYDDVTRMLNLMDIAVFDFLIGNMDRHHYESFTDFTNDTFTLLFDNGRAFGKSGHDELTILVPIYQCCMFRASTLHKLLTLQISDEKLSSLMERSLANDPLPDELSRKHLTALDRRVEKILLILNTCIVKNGGYQNVVIDDGF